MHSSGQKQEEKACPCQKEGVSIMPMHGKYSVRVQSCADPAGLDQRRIGTEDENLMLIRLYRKKRTLALR